MKEKLLFFTTLFVLALVPLFGGGCSAPASHSNVSIGEALPDFSLKDLQGETHTLRGYAGNVVVLEMSNIECPWSVGANPDLIDLQNRYADEGVVFLGIDSHATKTVDEIRAFTESIELNFPMLKDVDNVYADVLGAVTTPEIYILDKAGKLVYHGAFDDRKQPDEKGAHAYTENAIKAALAGEAANPAEVKSWGCTIKRK
ncbi:MAG: redoxin domain-containing protein [Candidatus Hydrogenedentales bacterium]